MDFWVIIINTSVHQTGSSTWQLYDLSLIFNYVDFTVKIRSKRINTKIKLRFLDIRNPQMTHFQHSTYHHHKKCIYTTVCKSEIPRRVGGFQLQMRQL